MSKPSEGIAASNEEASESPSTAREAVILELLAETMMETYRTSAKVKLLLRSLTDEMSQEVGEDRHTVRQALDEIARGDVKEKVRQFIQRLEEKGITLDEDGASPLADTLKTVLHQDDASHQP